MRRSIATVSLSGSLTEKLSAAAAARFDGVELFENDLISSTLTPAQVRAQATDLGLTIELYQPFRDFEAVSAEQLKRNLKRAEQKFAVMAALGAPMMLVCSNATATAIDDDALAAEQLYLLADRAAEHGLRIAYEALAWGTHVNDYQHSWRLVDSADHPALGLCLDSFHILSKGGDPAEIRDLPGEKIFFLQLADAPRPATDTLHFSRHYRCFPGQGAFDVTGFTEHVLAAGYRGPLSLEVFNDVFRQADAERTAVDALRSLIILGDAVRRRMPDQQTLSQLPDVSEPVGFAFAEISVDARSEPATRDLLTRMGFMHTANHRSKRVQQWNQGQIRLLLNRAHPQTPDWERGDAMVSVIGVEDPHSARSAVRAQALLGPPAPRTLGDEEARLPAVTMPDGTDLFFCRTDEPSNWRDDFVPVDADPPPAALIAIDHVALSPAADHFDETVLFYQATFGLTPLAPEDVADPYGLLRSRALTSPHFNLIFNVPAVGNADRPVRGQHIAFACTGIAAVAERFRAAGVPLLPIPPNYYDDLAARTDLADETVDRLRALGLLYERTETGEFYQFYVEALSRTLFFEVVERVGGYSGFGASNAPVRRAMQARSPAS